MDFQLARNLSALSRGQNEITEALLHIDCLSDYLNREIIMSATSSEATEQLVVSARTALVQVQNILETQSNEGARRLREAQVNFIATRPPVHLRLRTLFMIVKMMVKSLINRRLRDIVVLRKGLHPVRDIPLLKLRFEAGYGEMTHREKIE